MQIREFNVVQTAKVAASIHAIFGVAVGAFMMAYGLLIHGTPMGIALAVIFPVLYAVGGFVGVAFVCVVYNAVAERIGGIEFHTE